MKNNINDIFSIREKILKAADNAQNAIIKYLSDIDNTTIYNQAKILSAFQEYKLSDSHFNGTTGYGYNDTGREIIDKIYAKVFGTEDALVRHNFISGTHALSTALFGILRPGDILLSITGKPYDTLEEVIGISGEAGNGSLKDFGISYRQIDLLANGNIDYDSLKHTINDKVKLIMIQRSRGYGDRPALCISEMEKLIKHIKDINTNIICLVDNCYGEFTETMEPTNVGADLCVGSLIKNPGGGLAPTGGYIVGKRDLIEKISYRLTSVGIGKECGASLGFNRSILQGLFFAPHVVAESLKGTIFTAKFFEDLGYEVNPKYNEMRSDIIQSIKFGSAEKLIAFCQSIQSSSPVDSYAIPMPWDMPGYQHQVIMAAGTFVQGASIELSADAPIKEPYIAYIQGGMIYEYIKLAIMLAAEKMGL